jgi:hypothetical protein
VITGRWRWGERVPYAFSETGRIGFVINRHFTPLETCIALAFLCRAPETATRVVVNGEVHLRNISWREGEDEEEERRAVGERWSRLKGKVGCVPIEDGYLISNTGRLKNEQGDITRGFWFNHTRLAATNAGLVDLLLVARIKPNAVYLREALHEAAECLLSGQGAEDLSISRDIQLDSAWSLINTVALYLPASKLGWIGPNLVSDDLWDLLVCLKERRHSVLGGRLSDLKQYVDDRLEDGEYVQSDCQWGELRFGRLCIAAHIT